MNPRTNDMDENMIVQFNIKTLAKGAGLLLLTLTLPVSAGWVGDSLLDLIKLQTTWPAGESFYCLDGWFDWWRSLVTTPWSTESHALMAGAVAGFIIFFIAALWLYSVRRLLLTTHARVLPDATPDARTVLIMGLSPKYVQGKQDDKKDKAVAAMKVLPIEETAMDEPAQKKRQDLATDKTLLANLIDGRHAWQQGLRIVWHHIAAPHRTEALKAVLIVVSAESHTDFTEFKALLSERLNDAKQRGHINGTIPKIDLATPEGIDFENYNDTVDTLNAAVDIAVKKHKANHSQICIDATAGLKIFSIAAAMVTLNRKLIFSYVNNDGRPRYYDAKIDMGMLGEG